MTVEAPCLVKHRQKDLTWRRFFFVEAAGRPKYGTQTRVLEISDLPHKGEYAFYHSNDGPSCYMQGLSLTLI